MEKKNADKASVENLSLSAKSLWAKSPQSWDRSEHVEGSWLPLHEHMRDSFEVAKLLWDRWVSSAVKEGISEDFEFGRKIFLFLAAVHDIGKATPEFQSKKTLDNLLQRVRESGLTFQSLSEPNAVPHGIAGYVILERFFLAALPQKDFETKQGAKEAIESFAVIIGGHHGVPPSSAGIYDAAHSWKNNTGFNDKSWCVVQDELLRYALALSKVDIEVLSHCVLNVRTQVALTSLVILTDWIASDEHLFPYKSLEYPRQLTSAEYALQAWEKLQFYPRWQRDTPWPEHLGSEHFVSRFGLPKNTKPRPVQESVYEIAASVERLGIVIVEAPMGEGKTEAALLAAEILSQVTNRTGIFFALPTQATSDGIFPRILEWIDKIDDKNHSIFLAHGKARFNEDYRGLGRVSTSVSVWDEDGKNNRQGLGHNAVVHEWMQGRKKGLLADFAVGTIDQVLMAALKQKHLVLRHLGLMDKVVIIDECHAYDAYMSQYLEMALEWLGLYGVPVIVLSATLPSTKREAVVNAYLGTSSTNVTSRKPPWLAKKGDVSDEVEKKPLWATSRSYPLITYTSGSAVHLLEPDSSGREARVAIEFLEDGDENTALISLFAECLAQGGCACVIRNTVKRAQETARLLRTVFGDESVELFHSQFLSNDRIRKEARLREKLGPNGARPSTPYIVVGTQVLEQSLDVDFDVMVTDLAPIDLVLQRIGRLHRHSRNKRPVGLRKAKCYFAGLKMDESSLEFERGAEVIYGRYLLLKTFLILQNVESIVLPADIPRLVQTVYGEDDGWISAKWEEEVSSAKIDHEAKIGAKQAKAEAFRIRKPRYSSSVIDWLNTPAGSSEAQGSATVRDTSDSLEVVLVRQKQDGCLALLPWVGGAGNEYGSIIPSDCAPRENLAAIVAECTVKLPTALCTPWMIDRVIIELESKAWPFVEAWQESFWLKGELVLIFDENLETELCGFALKYDQYEGLSVRREGAEHE